MDTASTCVHLPELTHLYSFLPSTIKLWSSLPGSLVKLENINQFKDD